MIPENCKRSKNECSHVLICFYALQTTQVRAVLVHEAAVGARGRLGCEPNVDETVHKLIPWYIGAGYPRRPSRGGAGRHTTVIKTNAGSVPIILNAMSFKAKQTKSSCSCSSATSAAKLKHLLSQNKRR